MKKLLAPLAAAFAVMAAPAALAQTPETETEPTPAEVVDQLCDALATDPVEPLTCTPEQKAAAVTLITEISARPEPADEYEQMRYMYDFIEGLRRIFAPEEPAMAMPPRDRFDVEGYEICALLEERFGTICTLEQRDALRAMTIRFSQMPAPTTAEEQEARRQEVYRELDRIFPDLPRPQPETQQPSASTPAPVAVVRPVRLQVA